MGLPLYIIDAFTDRPFRGNPAAVCLLDGLRPKTWLQDVAREMNLSETAFILAEGDSHHLRWFTPTMEVDLCGHATLASAHLLWEQGLVPHGSEVRFLTLSGVLTAVQGNQWIELDFPAQPCKPLGVLFSLDELLGVPACLVGASRLDYLVEVADEETLRGLQPDLAGLARLSCRGMIVTSRSASREYDFVSRFFAPGAGIPEDPVTGSAHCCLGPYWGARLGKTVMVGYQASARGGVVRVELVGERVKLGGKAVTVVRGELGR